MEEAVAPKMFSCDHFINMRIRERGEDSRQLCLFISFNWGSNRKVGFKITPILQIMGGWVDPGKHQHGCPDWGGLGNSAQ